MRTFIPSVKRSYSGAKTRYRTQTSNEWDISINLPSENPQEAAATVVSYVRNNVTRSDTQIDYVLVSGIEYTEQARDEENTTIDNYHLHICLITKSHVNRAQALSCIRAFRIGHKEYSAIRNKKWSYYGWRVHHIKVETKIDPASLILFEYGTLPVDQWTDQKIQATSKVVCKFGSDEVKEDWKTIKASERFEQAEAKRKEIELFKKKEQARELHERCLMELEDSWLNSKLSKHHENELSIEPNLESVEKKNKRQRERSMFFRRRSYNAKRRKI